LSQDQLSERAHKEERGVVLWSLQCCNYAYKFSTMSNRGQSEAKSRNFATHSNPITPTNGKNRHQHRKSESRNSTSNRRLTTSSSYGSFHHRDGVKKQDIRSPSSHQDFQQMLLRSGSKNNKKRGGTRNAGSDETVAQMKYNRKTNWGLDQKDAADTIRIIGILTLWASLSLIIFVAQGDWFLNLVCSLLIVASFGGVVGTFPGVRLGNILVYLFKIGLVLIAIFEFLYVTLGTLEGSFENEYAASRCGNATKTWRENNFCTGEMTDLECEETCKSTVGKDLRIEMISCSAVMFAALMYAAYEIYHAEGILYPSNSKKKDMYGSVSGGDDNDSNGGDSDSKFTVDLLRP